MEATYYLDSNSGYATSSGFLNLLTFYSSNNRSVLFHTVFAYRVSFTKY